MSAVATEPLVRFHLSLNVADIGRSVDFFRSFLGREPAKRRSDYAKFELDEPPVVLSLEPAPVVQGGNLNHLGFRMPSAQALVECQRRLELAGIATQREEGVECCYARQTKFWVHDPDGNLWEIYTLDDDLDHRGSGQLPEAVPGPRGDSSAIESLSSERPQAIWSHRLGQTVPERLPILDATVDEVQLQGTFNAALPPDKVRIFLQELVRVLRPGGTVHLHVLTADRHHLDGRLALPGAAAMVEHAPVDTDLIRALESASFVAIRCTKLGDEPCFTVGQVRLRETRIDAFKPLANQPATRTVMYRGPFRQVEDDAGRVFRRGERASVDEPTWHRLRSIQFDGFLFQQD